MKSRRKVLAWVTAIVVVAIAAGAAAVLRFWPRRAPGVPPELVPSSWEQYRTSAGHQSHVDTGKAICSDCHNYEREGFKNPGAAPCARCHAKEEAHAHPGAASAKTDCLTCHTFAPNRQAASCIGCHAQPQGPLAAIAVHTTQECATCHRVHEELSHAGVGADCLGCHENERASKHAEHAGSRDCLDCHLAHAPARTAVTTCPTCHSQPAGPKPAGHESCLVCHRPHEFAAGGEQSCIRCHGTKPTLVAAQIEAHAVCTSCHAPHAPAQAADSCRGCHSNMQVAHGSKNACIDCHAPHPTEPNTKVLTCTSCHRAIAVSDTSAHAAGTPCESCHRPHDFSHTDGRTLCATCHARQMSLASTNKGHSDCTVCHAASLAHAPAPSRPCGDCHGKEQATVPKGHAGCAGCHEPHSGAVMSQATCASCHTNKTSGPHSGIKGGCAACHRAHGPGGTATPPPCVTCHSRDALPALHGAHGHADCAACHNSHDPPRSDRATCTGSCHADKRNHQQGAQVCSGCHVFRR